MKMTLNEWQKNYQGLNSLGKAVFPVKLSFAVRRNMAKLETLMELAEKERLELCRRYADRDEDGAPVLVDSIVNGTLVKEFQIPEKNRQNLLRELEELFDSETEIDIELVPESVIGQCEASERYTVPSMDELQHLSFMIG